MESVYESLIKVIPPCLGFTKEELVKSPVCGPLVNAGDFLVMSAPDTNVIIEPVDGEYRLSGNTDIVGDGMVVDEETMLQLVGWDGTRPVPEKNAAASLYTIRRSAIQTGWLSDK